jgi:predicted phage terminase large subunit-like protein
MCEWIRAGMCGDTPLARGKWRHVALISETAADCREVLAGDGKMVSDPTAGSGILQIHPPAFRPEYFPSRRRLVWPNGASASLYNATEPEALRGPEHDAAACDEICKWMYGRETFDQLQFGLRGGTNPQIFIATTPKPTQLLKDIIADPHTVTVRGSTLDNSANLPPQFIEGLMRRYGEHTRMGRQEIFAEIVDTVEGALFTQANIDKNRIPLHQLPPLNRIVIAIDPAVSSTEHSDETGIVCCGVDGSDPPRFYVLDDVSGRMSPLERARTAISLYHSRRADKIIAEKNNGGDLVLANLLQVDPNVPVDLVHASRGKITRAEPVASLFETGRVSLCGVFRKLEEQLTSMTVDFNAREWGFSPDRADAMVYAIQALADGCGESRQRSFVSIDMNGRGGYSAYAPADHLGGTDDAAARLASERAG